MIRNAVVVARVSYGGSIDATVSVFWPSSPPLSARWPCGPPRDEVDQRVDSRRADAGASSPRRDAALAERELVGEHRRLRRQLGEPSRRSTPRAPAGRRSAPGTRSRRWPRRPGPQPGHRVVDVGRVERIALLDDDVAPHRSPLPRCFGRPGRRCRLERPPEYGRPADRRVNRSGSESRDRGRGPSGADDDEGRVVARPHHCPLRHRGLWVGLPRLERPILLEPPPSEPN